MSRQGKHFTPGKPNDHHGHKLTPEEKRQKEEEHKKKMEALRKQAEEDAVALTPQYDVLIKSIKSGSTSDLELTIENYKRLVKFQQNFQDIHRGHLCPESAEKLGTQAVEISKWIGLLKNTFKEKIYARMDDALAQKDNHAYMDQHHPIAVRAHDAGMMTWDDVCFKLTEYDKIIDEINAPAVKRLTEKYTAMFEKLNKRLDEVDHTKDILSAYKAYILIWSDTFAIREEYLEDQRKYSKFMVKLNEALKMSFAGCKFGDQIFPRCDEEVMLHLKAYDSGPGVFNKYQDEFEAIREPNDEVTHKPNHKPNRETTVH